MDALAAELAALLARHGGDESAAIDALQHLDPALAQIPPVMLGAMLAACHGPGAPPPPVVYDQGDPGGSQGGGGAEPPTLQDIAAKQQLLFSRTAAAHLLLPGYAAALLVRGTVCEARPRMARPGRAAAAPRRRPPGALLALLAAGLLGGAATAQFSAGPVHDELAAAAAADLTAATVSRGDAALVRAHWPREHLLPADQYVFRPTAPAFTQNIIFDPCRGHAFDCCADTFGTPEFEAVAAATGARASAFADGAPVPGAYFVRAGGRWGGCALQAPRVPLVAFAGAGGAADFGAALGAAPAAARASANASWTTVDALDARVVLVGAPSGCFRFRYAYEPVRAGG